MQYKLVLNYSPYRFSIEVNMLVFIGCWEHFWHTECVCAASHQVSGKTAATEKSDAGASTLLRLDCGVFAAASLSAALQLYWTGSVGHNATHSLSLSHTQLAWRSDQSLPGLTTSDVAQRLWCGDVSNSLANHRLWGWFGGTSSTPTSATCPRLHPSSPLICKSLFDSGTFLGHCSWLLSASLPRANMQMTTYLIVQHKNATWCWKRWIWSFCFLSNRLIIYNLLWKLEARCETLDCRFDKSSHEKMPPGSWMQSLFRFNKITVLWLKVQAEWRLYLCLCAVFCMAIFFFKKKRHDYLTPNVMLLIRKGSILQMTSFQRSIKENIQFFFCSGGFFRLFCFGLNPLIKWSGVGPPWNKLERLEWQRRVEAPESHRDFS